MGTRDPEKGGKVLNPQQQKKVGSKKYSCKDSWVVTARRELLGLGTGLVPGERTAAADLARHKLR